MIELDGPTMRYRARTAVQDLTVQVLPGRVTAFLGPNGSGRTTTMRCVLGLTRPTSGAATVLGVPYAELAQPIRRVRALIDLRARHPGRIAHDHLRALAQSNALPRHRVDDVIELVGLDAVADERVRSFSLGMAQRLGIAFALLGDPRHAAVRRAGERPGPRRDRWVRHLLCGLAAEGCTVLVSSHLMGEMQDTADHLVVLGVDLGTALRSAAGGTGAGRAGVRVPAGPHAGRWRRRRAALPGAAGAPGG